MDKYIDSEGRDNPHVHFVNKPTPTTSKAILNPIFMLIPEVRELSCFFISFLIFMTFFLRHPFGVGSFLFHRAIHSIVILDMHIFSE